MEDQGLMTREIWGIPEISKYIERSSQTAHTYTLQKGFPDPKILIGTRIKGWDRRQVIAWYRARQKAES